MKYKINTTRHFDKAVKRCLSRGYDISKLKKAMLLLERDRVLPQSYSPHKLKGFMGNIVWECHLEPDWLLIYLKEDRILTLTLVDTGTHADLFDM